VRPFDALNQFGTTTNQPEHKKTHKVTVLGFGALMKTLLHSPPPRLLRLLLPYFSIPWVEALLFLLPICVHMWKDQRLLQLQKCCKLQNGATDLDSFLLFLVLLAFSSFFSMSGSSFNKDL
jgi:hypothetical protein